MVFKIVLHDSSLSPGSSLQGRLVVSLDTPKKYHTLVVRLWGGATVQWVEPEGKTSVYYRSSKTYVDAKEEVWKAENSPTGDFPIGEHTFPFRFQLPHNVPPFFLGKHGNVLYKLEAGILRTGKKSTMKYEQAAMALLVIRDRTSAGASILTLCKRPVMLEKSKRLKILLFYSGSISITATLPRTGFSPGERIPISAHVSNDSSRQIRIAASLRRIETFTASKVTGCRQTKQRSAAIPVAKVQISGPIMPGANASYEDSNLEIPTEVPLTMRNCSYIKVEYILTVKVVIPWSFNLRLKFPIVIANGPLSADGPAVPFSLQPQAALEYHTPQGTSLTASGEQEQSYLPSYSEAIRKV